MTTRGLVFFLVIALGIVIVFLYDAVQAWRRWRGVRLISCPETTHAAAVTVDTAHAALTMFLEGAPNLRLATCSRWATRGRCRQPCLGALARAGPAATVDALMASWYAGRRCSICGRHVSHATSRAHTPALAGGDGITVEWRSVPAEQLVDLFETHRAVCWDCHHAESFRRLHPDLYVDRPAPTTRRP